MNIKEEIEEYVPVNSQEEKAKEYILKAYDTFDDIFTRDNEFVHFTSSAFVTNSKRNKILMIYHNIYNSWCWVGGHADGDEDLLHVAKKELEEETSVKNFKVLADGKIMSIDTLPVAEHIKRGKNVSAHVHLSVAYIFEADENDMLKIKEDENSNVSWIDIDKVVEMSKEPHMKPVYEKLIARLHKLG